jgi:hypothetical protein
MKLLFYALIITTALVSITQAANGFYDTTPGCKYLGKKPFNVDAYQCTPGGFVGSKVKGNIQADTNTANNLDILAIPSSGTSAEYIVYCTGRWDHFKAGDFIANTSWACIPD